MEFSIIIIIVKVGTCVLWEEREKSANRLEKVESGMVENAFLLNRSNFGMFRECACNSS